MHNQLMNYQSNVLNKQRKKAALVGDGVRTGNSASLVSEIKSA